VAAPGESRLPVRIVVADDYDLFRSSLAMLLDRREEFVVVGTARDGEEAIAEAVARNAEIVLMDVRMPNTDGIEATQRLLELRPELQIVLMSGTDADGEYDRRAIEVGAVAFLVKDDVVRHVVPTLLAIARREPLH
jgi:DNA-binding NarL/FixJ family response regulator